MILFQDDCLNVFSTINDMSIDFICCDMPYGTTPCKWDTPIDLVVLSTEIKRIIKPNGVIALFGTEPFSSNLRMSMKDIYKYDWYWKKCRSLGANFCHAKNSPIKNIETISIFSPAKINHIGKTKNRMNYFPQGLKDCSVLQNHKSNKVNAFKKLIEGPSHKKYTRTQTGFPDQILDFKFEKTERKNRFHPTQKPISLLEYLIRTYTVENDIVLDFTMGSGSTGVACKNTNRKFIGIEKDKDYFAIAEKRLKI